MKNTRKFLAALLVILTLLMSMASLTAYAADSETVLYLTPNSNWKSDNARFAMYVWVEGGDYQWIDMTDPDGDEIYEGILPAGYTNVIFCRMNPDTAENGWSNGKMWNQTNDLVYDGTNNHYTIGSGSWDKGDGKWSVYDVNACSHSYGTDCICTKCGDELFYIIAGNVMKISGTDSYAAGDNSTLFGSKWDVTDENNRMEYDPESECYIKIYENVAAGEYHFKVAENKSWDISYGHDGGNCYLKVDEDGSMVVITFKDGNITVAADRQDSPTTPDDSNKPGDSGNNDDSDNESDGTKEPEVKLNFFQRIWKAITDFFKKLFGEKKK